MAMAAVASLPSVWRCLSEASSSSCLSRCSQTQRALLLGPGARRVVGLSFSLRRTQQHTCTARAFTSRPPSPNPLFTPLRPSPSTPSPSPSPSSSKLFRETRLFSALPTGLTLGAQYVADVAATGDAIEFSVQIVYLLALLAFLATGSFLVVRQVLIRRELETTAKDLQERARKGECSAGEYFDLGAVMLRKKYYFLAIKYLDQAIDKWDGDPAELSRVYNALGFAHFQSQELKEARSCYERALEADDTYVTAWNNLGDVFEKSKEYREALRCYRQALSFDESNPIAKGRLADMETKVQRLQL
eukprot:jgi/Chlat1/2732/Chrsp182S02890